MQFIKEIEDAINRWKDILASWARRIKTTKMTILLVAIHKFNVIPIKNTQGIFHRTRTNNVKICMEIQKNMRSNSDLEKEQSGYNHAI